MAPEPPAPSRSAPPSAPSGALGRRSTLAITNLTKLAGLGIGINETLVRPHRDALVVIFAAVLIAGAQATESLVLAVIDRVLGGNQK